MRRVCIIVIPSKFGMTSNRTCSTRSLQEQYFVLHFPKALVDREKNDHDPDSDRK